MFGVLARTILAASVMLALMLAYIVPAGAAQIRDEARRLEDERREDKQRERAFEPKPGVEIEVAPVAKVKKENVCFQIDTIHVKGVKSIDYERVREIVKPFENKCIGPKVVEKITQLITNEYLNAGLITSRTYIPEQDINDGSLDLEVIEGFIEGITYFEKRGDSKKLGPESIIGMTFPTRPGDLLELRKIEQGIDQINRVASSTATLDIKPGKKAGGSIVEITNTVDDTFRGSIGYDYTYFEGLASKQAQLTLEADNLLDINDSWYLVASGGEFSNAATFSMSFPYLYANFSFTGSYSEQISQLTPTAELYTQIASVSTSAEYLINRDSTSKTRISAGLSEKWNFRYVNASELLPQKLTVVQIGGSYEKYLDGGYVSITPNISAGLPIFDASKDTDNSDDPKSRFYRFSASAVYYKMLHEQISLYTSGYAQISPHVLYSSEQMTLGGKNSVRGFGKVGRSGDDGIYMRNEVAVPLSYLLTKASFSLPKEGMTANVFSGLKPFIFFDTGYLYDRANGTKYAMAGAGLGMRFNSKRLNFDMLLGVPVAHSKTITDTADLEAAISVTLKLF